jgi:hypothetical protein
MSDVLEHILAYQNIRYSAGCYPIDGVATKSGEGSVGLLLPLFGDP